MDKYVKKEKNFSEQDRKFNNYLNKTLIMCSKKYFKKQCNYINKENLILDNNDFSDYLESLISENKFDFNNINENLQLNIALTKLSVIEQAVIFLLFEEDLSQDEAGKILEICSKSVSRIKLRALNKIKNYLKGDC